MQRSLGVRRPEADEIRLAHAEIKIDEQKFQFTK